MEKHAAQSNQFILRHRQTVEEKYRKYGGYRKLIKGRKERERNDGQVSNERAVDIEKPQKVNAERCRPFGGMSGISRQRTKRKK
jgi:hypothetical protein